MMKIISCRVPSGTKVQEVLASLQSAKFTSHDISILFSKPPHHRLRGEPHTQISETRKQDDLWIGSSSQAFVRRLGIEIFLISSLGIFTSLYPIVETLNVAMMGEGVGHFLKEKINISHTRVKNENYRKNVKEEHILISVHADDETRRNRALETFIQCGLEDDIDETVKLNSEKYFLKNLKTSAYYRNNKITPLLSLA